MSFLFSYEKLKGDKEILSYIDAANKVLGQIGYTEHGVAHAVKTGTDASIVLEKLGYDEENASLQK